MGEQVPFFNTKTVAKLFEQEPNSISSMSWRLRKSVLRMKDSKGNLWRADVVNHAVQIYWSQSMVGKVRRDPGFVRAMEIAQKELIR